jgi:hypothetical protein
MTYSVPEGSVDLEYPKNGGMYVPNKEGVTTWFTGDIYSTKLTGPQTGGQIGLVEATVPPGGGPAPHVHEQTRGAPGLEHAGRYFGPRTQS